MVEWLVIPHLYSSDAQRRERERERERERLSRLRII